MQTSAQPIKYRIGSIDILRGIIMIIMALDHTRDFLHFSGPQYLPTNMATTTVILFFTRWITHFCAPVFVFLSGVSAFLAGQRRSKKELSVFLIKRGIWLMLADMIIISLVFTFDPSYSAIFLEILWAIGGSMVILGLLVRGPLFVTGLIGGLIFFGHDIITAMNLPQSGITNTLTKLFFTAAGTIFPVGKRVILDLYAIIPWTGVMLIGYVFGSYYRSSFDPRRRRKILLVSGAFLVIMFVVLRYINVIYDPVHWSVQRNWAHTLLSFLNTSKYPPSLLYLCMTLGPAMVLLSLVERVQNKLTAIFIVYGNVPLFYFIVHLFIIRLICVILFFASGFSANQISDPNSVMLFKPATFGYPLWAIYLLWIFVVALLYLPCKWYGNYKRTHGQWWLSYL